MCLVGCQNIGVAVFAETAGFSRLQWIKPGTGTHLHDALPNLIVNPHASQAGAPIIEHGYYIARLDVTHLRISGM